MNLHAKFHNSDIILFADDTNIFIRATSKDAAYAKAYDTDLYLHFRFLERSLKKLFMTDYIITLFHREHFMTDSLVFAKITLQVMPSMFLLTILKQQSVMETMSLEYLLI